MDPMLQRFGDVTIQRLDKTKNEEQTNDEEDERASKRQSDDTESALKRLKTDDNGRVTPKPNLEDDETSEYDEESESDIESETNEPSTTHDNPADQNSSTNTTNLPDEPTKPNDFALDIKAKLKEMGEISFQTVKKGEKPKKMSLNTENEVVVTPTKKTTDDESTNERKGANMRRNIREVMDETKLDESTLAAQRLEAERLQRVQEQQKMLRDLQRQNAQERMQHKVLSLLQGNGYPKPGTSSTRIGNTVLLKLPNGQARPMARVPKRPLDLTKLPPEQLNNNLTPGTMLTPRMPMNSYRSPIVRKTESNLTPSVSIAPVTKKFASPPPSIIPSDTESEEEEDVKPESLKDKLKDVEPVQTIDISSDEDCIVVSEPESSDETEEDPSNSGMHTNDEFNQPDEQGRVLVNVGHPDNDADVFVAPQIARVIKPHQIGGVRFLYDNVIESTSRFESSAGFGCILAHSMGLGKTLQLVCFSDIFLRHTASKTILCIMPINTLQNWMAEYNMWLPTEENVVNSPLLTHGEVRPRTFNLHVLNDSHKTLAARAKVISLWKNEGGVLLIGYELFRLLSLKKLSKSRKKAQVVEVEDDKNKALFDDVHEALVKPGPDLVICDEGHRIKNSHASISQALKQMKTKRRIVLTGYPLQNNLMEYWCMVDFVRPNYLGTKTEFCNMFERPIMNGQCIDSTESDIKLMRYRAHVLHSLLVGFVQRRSHTVLQNALPQKEEYVLLVRMLPFQRKLYETFMNEVVRIQAVPNPLKAFAVCCKIWNHPDVLYNFMKKRARGDAVDIDLEEVAGNATGETKKKNSRTKRATGKKGAKPAASVTPYNSTSETPPNSSQNFNSENFQNTNLNYNNQTSFSQNFYPNQSPRPPTNDFINNISDNSQYNYHTDYDQQNFNSYQQNYWNNQQNEYFGNSTTQPQQYYNSNSNQSWIKKEDTNDSKPKINIISDIKIPTVFNSNSNSSDKKINILSDIKLETKNEENDVKAIDETKIEHEDEIKSETTSSTIGTQNTKNMKEDSGIPYDWAVELLKDYVPGHIENSAKMEILFCIIRESIALDDRLLVFSQSLITLDLIEQFLQMSVVPGDTLRWARNVSYYRLDGSTSALEREKLINEFNSNPKIHLFLVSTRAGSLGINLIGANRVVVLDASWNPCHDTQAVCRVYRYGQRKPCFVYRLVVDNCLEKKIYDRQINKQGMSDRVVDECNPDAHLTMKDVSTLCWDDNADDGEEKDWLHMKDNYIDVVLQKVIADHGRRLNKEPFQHESLLVDRKEKQLSQQEKRLAKRGYEREKQAARQPAYSVMGGTRGYRPVASVRPIQQPNDKPSRWIPAEHWQRQGMTAQEMTLPLDVVIPTNQPEKDNIVLKAGQKVLVLKSPKGVYMQLESGKIVAIKTAIRVRGKAEDNENRMAKPIMPPMMKSTPTLPMPQKRIIRPFVPGVTKMSVKSIRQTVPPNTSGRMQGCGRISIGDDRRTFPDGMKDAMTLKDMPGSSSDEEHLERRQSGSNDEFDKNLSLLKKKPISVRRLSNTSSNEQKRPVSALEKLERTATSVNNDHTPFQETLDSITNSYKDTDVLEDENKQQTSDASDHSDDVMYVPESQPPPQNQYYQSPEVKNEITNDYYNTSNPVGNYYNYNAPSYHAAPPPPPPHPPNYNYTQPQPQQAPPPPPSSYDMMNYQQPQYNYGYQNYPQTHYPPPPPPPHPPPQSGYDYNPQAMYGGYGYGQQYPPPPPPQGMYPPPPPPVATPSGNPPNYDYQYAAMNAPNGAPNSYYPNT